MKRRGTLLRPGLAIILPAVVLVLSFRTIPARCATTEVALLLQQTPWQGGTVSPQAGVHHFRADTAITLVAIPCPGYTFVYWLGDVDDPTASKTTTTLDKPKVIVAIFEQVNQDQLVVGQAATTRSPAIGAGGDISPLPTAAAPAGGGGGRAGKPKTPTTEGDDPIPPGEPPTNPPTEPPDTPPPDNPPPDNPPPIEPPPIEPPPVEPPPDIPEPTTGLLLGAGALALLRNRRGT